MVLVQQKNYYLFENIRPWYSIQSFTSVEIF